MIALSEYNDSMPLLDNSAKKVYASYFNNWYLAMPVASDYQDNSAYMVALGTWSSQKPTAETTSAVACYLDSFISLEISILDSFDLPNSSSSYLTSSGSIDTTLLSNDQNEILGAYLIALNPNNSFNDAYFTANNEETPSEYDVTSLIVHIASNDITTYLT